MKLIKLFISPSHNYYGRHGKPAGDQPMIEMTEIECVAGRGVAGDRFFDYKPDYKGQITFFSQSVYEDLCEEFAVFDKDVDCFRRNVIVSDVDLNDLIGQRFRLQDVTFEGTTEASPCYWMDQAFCPGAEKALRGRGGLRARIVTDGILRVANA